MAKKEVETFVKAVLTNKNVKAQATLEKILKEKVAKRISDILKND